MGMGYVDIATEREIVRAQLEEHPIEHLDAVLTPSDVVRIRQRRSYRRTLPTPCSTTRSGSPVRPREHPDVELGASPRSSISLVRCAQARALLGGPRVRRPR